MTKILHLNKANITIRKQQYSKMSNRTRAELSYFKTFIGIFFIDNKIILIYIFINMHEYINVDVAINLGTCMFKIRQSINLLRRSRRKPDELINWQIKFEEFYIFNILLFRFILKKFVFQKLGTICMIRTKNTEINSSKLCL